MFIFKELKGDDALAQAKKLAIAGKILNTHIDYLKLIVENINVENINNMLNGKISLEEARSVKQNYDRLINSINAFAQIQAKEEAKQKAAGLGQ